MADPLLRPISPVDIAAQAVTLTTERRRPSTVTHRIICTERQTVSEPNSHAHIVKVGTIENDGWLRLWTVDQILWAMSNGDTFYTKGKTNDVLASVIPDHCPLCGQPHIRSGPDAMADNNLDSLPTGKWT
jgi:hypothetical protein